MLAMVLILFIVVSFVQSVLKHIIFLAIRQEGLLHRKELIMIRSKIMFLLLEPLKINTMKKAIE